MHKSLHRRAFVASVIWTLGLLFLGSVVHATESSLACPDWPTCFGTMMPEMTGGVFWEHLHRLVAGGLLVLWLAATWFAWREAGTPPGIKRGAIVGMALLLVQSAFGGLTVIFLLPDAISTTHLSLALVFLVLATALAVASRRDNLHTVRGPKRQVIRAGAIASGTVVFLQSVVGAAVRHTDSGLACPDIPLCLDRLVPPLDQWPIALHFGHRVFGIVAALVVLVSAWAALRDRASQPRLAPWLMGTAGSLVVLQVVLGFLSVYTFLAVLPVSLHTLVAASALACATAAAALTWDVETPGELPEARVVARAAEAGI
jgi:heme A synthase